MKRQVIAVTVAVCLLAAAAAGAEIVVYSGAIYDVLIDMPPWDVGLPNPGGENLVGFMVKIRNTTGDSGYDPAGFNGSADGRTGFTTCTYTPGLHNQKLMTTPTLDQEMTTSTATLIDTHFNFLNSQVLYVGTPPSETNDLATSVEPTDAVGPWAGMATCDFGDRLYGNFALVGGAAADIDGDGDAATWELAWIVCGWSTTWIDMDFFISSTAGGEAIVGSLGLIPEPATVSLLALGAIGLRRKR